ADHDQQIALADLARCALERRGRKHLAEPDDVGPQQRAAFAMRRQIIERLVLIVRGSLARAANAKKIAVKLDDVARTGARVKRIDILRDDDGIFELRDR